MFKKTKTGWMDLDEGLGEKGIEHPCPRKGLQEGYSVVYSHCLTKPNLTP